MGDEALRYSGIQQAFGECSLWPLFKHRLVTHIKICLGKSPLWLRSTGFLGSWCVSHWVGQILCRPHPFSYHNLAKIPKFSINKQFHITGFRHFSKSARRSTLQHGINISRELYLSWGGIRYCTTLVLSLKLPLFLLLLKLIMLFWMEVLKRATALQAEGNLASCCSEMHTNCQEQFDQKMSWNLHLLFTCGQAQHQRGCIEDPIERNLWDLETFRTPSNVNPWFSKACVRWVSDYLLDKKAKTKDLE